VTPNPLNDEIEALVEKLTRYRNEYERGNSFISDNTYDALEARLKTISPNHPFLKKVGASLLKNSKIAHSVPMLSLNKTYKPEEIIKFFEHGNLVCVDKIDGMALKIVYNNLGNLIVASTRGNGKIGENVLNKVLHIKSIPQKIENIKQKLSTILKTHSYSENFLFTHFEVRGEIYFPKAHFDLHFAGEFESYRNAVAGTFGRKEIQEALPVLNALKFYSFEAFFLNEKNLAPVFNTHFEKLNFLETLGFNCGVQLQQTLLIEKPTNPEHFSLFLNTRMGEQRDYLRDGLVFRVNQEDVWAELGNTSHHPRGSVAFKLQGESVATKIEDIETALGKSGRVTFRAKLEPVYLSGAKISYATLHNPDFITEGGYAPGATVLIKRSGEVIPAIIELVLPSSKAYALPSTCPCGYSLEKIGPNLYCNQNIQCEPKSQEELLYFVNALEIKGVSEKIVAKLKEAGLLKTPADFFKLTSESLENLPGLGKKSAENIIQAIQLKQKLSFSEFLFSLGLNRGGEVKTAEVAMHFETLEALKKAQWEDFLTISGWAEKSAKDFLSSLIKKEITIQNLLEVVEITPSTKKIISVNSPLNHKVICITGKLSQPREYYENFILSHGGKISQTVNSKTDFLICNDASNSSKYKSAEKLKKTIYTEEEFLSHFDKK
jgi:DNA ligase (NAD+)